MHGHEPCANLIELGGEGAAALRPTSSDDRTASPGGHALTEAMLLGALPVVRLICPLHGGTSDIVLD